MLDSKFFSGNRRALQKTLNKGELMVFTAHAKVQRSADTSFFSQQRDFYYLTGIDESDWLLVIGPTAEYLIAPKLTPAEKIFDGSLADSKATKISGVDQVFDNVNGWNELTSQLKTTKEVQTIIPSGEKIGSTYLNPAQNQLNKRLKTRTKAKILSVHPLLHDMRAIKQKSEIESIQKAIDITGQALSKIRDNLSSFSNERDLQASITSDFTTLGAQGHAYDPIVARGVNACTLHYIANSSPLDKNQLVLLDVGAQVNYYCADITRVISLTEKPTQRQMDVHQAVDSVRQSALKLIKPNVNLIEYFRVVDQLMAKELINLGLISKSDPKKIRTFFPHGISHYLGLDVHDVAPETKVFKENMVLTVEPGIYIPDESIGVRLEDDILVTSSGTKVLSGAISLEL